MAKLFFYYGTMGSSKTANALMVSYNYKEVGKRAILVKPDTDTRSGKYKIHSRTGLEEDCIIFSDFEKWSDGYIQDYDVVIVDEAQFCTKEQVDFLSDIVDRLNIPVICYGLHADFKNDLFEGSARLLTIADVIEEIKMGEDNNWRKVYKNLNDAMYVSHPYKREVIGTKEIIAGISQQEIMRYYKTFYSPQNITTIVAGEFNEDEMINLIKQNFKFKSSEINPCKTDERVIEKRILNPA